MAQVTRAYSKDHIHAMINEKIYKSSAFLSTLSKLKEVTWDTDFFDIAIFVPSHLQQKAAKIATYANNILNVVSVFRVLILSAGENENRMFPSNFVPPKNQLVGRNRKYTLPILHGITKALNDSSNDWGYDDNVDSDEQICGDWFLSLLAM